MKRECESCIKRKTTYFPTSMECMATDDMPYYQNRIMLLEENQELKKHLKVPKACNLKTLEDYKSYYEDTTREQILEDTYIEYCAYVNLAHRYSELKKQLENCYCNRTDCSGRIKDSKVYDSLVQKVETQQKEFINYLENMLDDENDIFSVVRVKDALQKYKEIIGDDK